MTAENSRPYEEAAAVNWGADSTTISPTTDKIPSVTLLPEHEALLDKAGIPREFALLHGVRSVTCAAELPADVRQHAKDDLFPAVLFPWRGPDGAVHHQLRPDTPVVIDAEARKYLQASNVRLLNVLGDVTIATEVWIVEGTKQCLSARMYAPEHALVIGVPGCANAMKDGLLLPGLADLVEDLPVIVLFDADLATNEGVWLAAHQLGQALDVEGASSVRYATVPGDGKTGLDDLLGSRLLDKRAKLLRRIVDKARNKLPTRPRASAVADGSRPAVNVTGDRLGVIEGTVRLLQARWDGWRVFNYGDVITELTDDRMMALEHGSLLGLLAETAHFYRPGRAGVSSATWPDDNVIRAVAARQRDFTPLDRLSQAPFVRIDGTICQSPGYDQQSRTFLIQDPMLAGVAVPDSPTSEQMQQAVDLLTEWFCDMSASEKADKANLFALILTPFVRGLVPLVPMAVLDGLQPGVGKNLMADCIALLVTGSNADPLPFPGDDDELRKVITSTFGTGAPLFVFDEAHTVAGKSLARALTATSYTDRILGVSRMATYPNNATWMALGNQVQVQGDLARRVYRIALRPPQPDPERRRNGQFLHPDLRAWTRQNRPHLIQAVLTLVRGWFAAGQPAAPTGVSFGSFEAWDRIIGGILYVAGVPGFLANLARWRSEADFETGYWTDHLRDLSLHFKDEGFTIRDVVESIGQRRVTEMPPGLEDCLVPSYSRQLGQAYARIKDRWYGGYRLTVAGAAGEGGARGKVNRWRIEKRDDIADDGSSSTPNAGTSIAEPVNKAEKRGEGSPDTSVQPAASACVTATELEPTRLRAAQLAPESRVSTLPSHQSIPAASGLVVTFSAAEEERLAQLAATMSRTGLRVDKELLEACVVSQAQTRGRLCGSLARQLQLPEAAAATPRPWTTNEGLAAFARVAGDSWPQRQDGKPRVNKELAAAAAAQGGDLGAVCTLIQELLENSPFPAALEEHRLGDRVHPHYSMKTHTGRWTSTKPNILGVGHRTERLLQDRDLILAEPGCVMVAVDLAGIDARCVAGLSGDRGYAELFQLDRDIHNEMSQLFFGDQEHRQQAKAITHGIPYGRGARAIAHATGMSVADTKRMVDAYFWRYPAIRKWQEHLRQLAAQGHPVPTGTGRWVPGDPNKAYTTAPARAAQACARDLAGIGLLRVIDDGLQSYVRLFLHDELVLSVPQSQANSILARVTELMSFDWVAPTGLVVPIVAQPASSSGPRWSDVYRVEGVVAA